MKKILTITLLLFACFMMAEDIAIFTKIQGEVYSVQDTIKTFHQQGDFIGNNSTIYSNADSYALLQYKFTNGSLRIFPNSVVSIISVDSLNTKVSLSGGKILNDLKDKITGSYTVETNSTVASVRGTSFEVFITEEGTDVKVVNGNVDVLNKISGKSHSLGANQRLISRNSGELIELTPEGNPLPAPEDEKEEPSESSNQSRNNNLSSPIVLTVAPTTLNPNVPAVVKTEDPVKTSLKEEVKTKSDSSEFYPIAVVLKIKGELLLIRNDQELECPVGTILQSNDKVRTADNSLALVKFVDNSSQIRIFSNSEVIINAEHDKDMLNKNLELKGGSILSNVNKKIVGKYSVSTSSTIASVRGTEFLVELIDGITRVSGFSGQVEVENKKTGEKVMVTKGNTATSKEDGTLDRQETGEIPADVNEELQSIEYENTMKINFENEDGSIKTIILEY